MTLCDEDFARILLAPHSAIETLFVGHLFSQRYGRDGEDLEPTFLADPTDAYRLFIDEVCRAVSSTPSRFPSLRSVGLSTSSAYKDVSFASYESRRTPGLVEIAKLKAANRTLIDEYDDEWRDEWSVELA